MIKTIALGLTAMMAFQSAAQAATTIDFDALRGRNGQRAYVNGPYSEDGFQLTSSRCTTSCYSTGTPALSNLDRDGAALTNFVGGTFNTLKKIDGAAFLLQSMDLASTLSNSHGLNQPTFGAEFTFNFLDGTKLVKNYELQSIKGQHLTVNTLDFDLAPLTSFSWKGTTNTSSGFLQFDNIVLNNVTAAVPEPATWAMMITGFGFVGGAMRRRNQAPALA